MKLLAVCIGDARSTPGRKAAKTGIFKEPVDYPVLVGKEGIAGDHIINRKYHGGPEQAVYIEGSVDLDWWCTELGRPVPPGTFGENLVIEGLDNRAVAVGDRFEIGEVLLEVTSARMPCATFALKMDDPTFVKRYVKALRAGPYARVIREGEIRAGDDVRYIAYQGDRITMPELMRTFGKKLQGAERETYLAAPINSRLREFLSD